MFKLSSFLVFGAGCLAILMFCPPGQAQEKESGKAPASPLAVSTPIPPTHRFWDKTNIALFLGVATVRALDFTSTEHFRERGHNEVLLSNSIVDNKPLFATIEVGGTAGSIAVAYLLHRKGHHRLERWVSIVHIGVGAFGDIRNYSFSRVVTPP